MTYIPFLALLGGSVVGTAAEGIINGILNFITSPYFTALIVVVAVLIVLWILLKIYGSMRAARLGRIIYERHFSEEGVYEGEEVELIETIRNPGFFPLLGVDVESYPFSIVLIHLVLLICLHLHQNLHSLDCLWKKRMVYVHNTGFSHQSS